MGGGSADEIIMTSTSNPEVLAVCYAQGWCADANYMTKSEAEVVTSIGIAFRNNTSITHFEEFEYFTNPLLTVVPKLAFYSSTLTSITLPNQILTLDTDSFRGSLLQSILLNEGLQTINRTFYGVPLTELCIPSTVTNVGGGFLYRTSCYALIMKPTTPPAITRIDTFTAFTGKIYVPDNSVDLYKEAEVWSDRATSIFGFTQLQTDYPDLYNKYLS